MINIDDILIKSFDNSCEVLTSDLLYNFSAHNLGFTLFINDIEFGHFSNCDFAVVYSDYGDFEDANFYVCKGNELICSFNTVFEFNYLTYSIDIDENRYNSYIIKIETENWNE